jgi:hypothetical protein
MSKIRILLFYFTQKKIALKKILKKKFNISENNIISAEEAAKLVPILYAALTFSSFCQNSLKFS